MAEVPGHGVNGSDDPAKRPSCRFAHWDVVGQALASFTLVHRNRRYSRTSVKCTRGVFDYSPD